MAQLFISHSTRDAKLVKELSDLLEMGAGVRGADIFASSIDGKDVKFGYVNDVLTNKVAGADLVLCVLSHNFLESTYCMLELGAAWRGNTPVVLMTTPGLGKDDLPPIFSGHQVEHLQHKRSFNKLSDLLRDAALRAPDMSVSAWESRRDEFLDWLRSDYQKAPPSQRVEDLPNWRKRGHWSESIVDGTLYIGSSYMNLDAKTEIARTIERGLVLPTVYAYLTNTGYHNWLRLTEDESYQYYADSLELVKKHDKALVKKIHTAVGRRDIDLISLGPGDGKKDLVLLKALAEGIDVAELYYYPFDVNSSMISRSMGRAGKVRALQNLQVKAINADFVSLPEFSPIYRYRDAPNVLSLLGNTLGNMPDDRAFLQQIHTSAMYDGDLLLLEVRQHQADETVPRTEANKAFDFGPLEVLGVQFEPDKLHYKTVSQYSHVPDTKTVLALYEEIEYGGETHKDVKLSLIHEYDLASLEEVCETIGFKVLSNKERHGSAAALLLQK